jgi:hypothetical protein
MVDDPVLRLTERVNLIAQEKNEERYVPNRSISLVVTYWVPAIHCIFDIVGRGGTVWEGL